MFTSSRGRFKDRGFAAFAAFAGDSDGICFGVSRERRSIAIVLDDDEEEREEGLGFGWKGRIASENGVKFGALIVSPILFRRELQLGKRFLGTRFGCFKENKVEIGIGGVIGREEDRLE